MVKKSLRILSNLTQHREVKMGSGADERNILKLGGNPGGPANDRQVGGDHYRRAKYEHWDIVTDHELNYFEAQILRYVMRCRFKKNMLEDLHKAEHYIQKYIELVDEGRIEDPTRTQIKENLSKAYLASTI